MTLVSPQSYRLAVHGDPIGPTACEKINGLTQQYQALGCVDLDPRSKCIVIQQKIKLEASTDLFSEASSPEFTRTYVLDSSAAVNNAPEQPSSLFDVWYTYSVYAELNEATHFDLIQNESTTTLALVESMNPLSPMQFTRVGLQPALKVTNRLLACAIESGLVGLKTKGSDSVTPYQPQANLRYPILEKILKRALHLSQSKNSSSLNNFLLGVSVGNELKALAEQTKDPTELNLIAMSIRHILLEKTEDFKLRAEISKNGIKQVAIELMNPKFSVDDANLEFTFKKEN